MTRLLLIITESKYNPLHVTGTVLPGLLSDKKQGLHIFLYPPQW